MIIVTGGAGFIGSNIVKQLNNKGRNDILIVDDLTDGRKIRNIEMLDFADYIDYEDFDTAVEQNTFDCGPIEVVFHEGACADTMNYDGRYMMKITMKDLKISFIIAKNVEFLSSMHLLHLPMDMGLMDSVKTHLANKL